MDTCFQKFYKIIDFETFEVIQSNNKNTTYFKDKNHVYLDSFMNYFTIIEDATPKDFKVLDIENGFQLLEILITITMKKCHLK
ncbi:MAG: hypothetical protein HC854_08720 [Flavobacterium sp.]|nr:hypothetical protein [Flavobacterium sp.]